MILLVVVYQINTIQYSQADKQIEKIVSLLLTQGPSRRQNILIPNISKKVQTNILVNLNHHYQFYTRTLLSTLNINIMFGKILLLVLLSCTPCNAFLTMILISANLSTIHFISITFIILYEFLFLFGLHLVAVNYSKHIHRTGKTLLSVNVRLNSNYLSIRERLRLSSHISTRHTRQQYGITYGTLGLITFTTFFKVSIYSIILNQHLKFSFSVYSLFSSIPSLLYCLIDWTLKYNSI